MEDMIYISLQSWSPRSCAKSLTKVLLSNGALGGLPAQAIFLREDAVLRKYNNFPEVHFYYEK